jgi:hypothetical protein
LWLCRQFAPIPIQFLSKTDRSGAGVTCHRVGDLQGVLRAYYWLWKASQWLESLPEILP